MLLRRFMYQRIKNITKSDFSVNNLPPSFITPATKISYQNIIMKFGVKTPNIVSLPPMPNIAL